MSIICIVGGKYNGKDMVSNHLTDKYNFKRYGFADPMKEGVKHMFDFTDEQVYGSLKEVIDERWNITPREVMQVFGTELCQFDLPKYLPALAPIGEAIWCHRFEIWYAKQPANTNIVFNDCRFQHEASLTKRLGGHVWKIIRPGYDVPTDSHKSENSLNNIQYDHLIINNKSLDELYTNIDYLYDNFVINK